MCLAHLFSFFIKVKKIIQGYDFSSEFSFDHIFIHFKVLCNYSFDFSLWPKISVAELLNFKVFGFVSLNFCH